METNPGKILQMNGIEVAPDDPRPTERILADMIARNLVTTDSAARTDNLSDSVLQVMESGCARSVIANCYASYIGCVLCARLRTNICDSISSAEATGI